MLFKPTEVDVEVVERGEEFAEGTVFSELREGVDIFRETLAAVATLAVELQWGLTPLTRVNNQHTTQYSDRP